MKGFKHLLIAIFMVMMGFAAKAQTTEGAILSLYSQYGLGELSTLGTAASKGMGGVGIANRDMLSLNVLNPAAYTSIERQSALLSVSGEGFNNYLKTAKGSNSKNYFNLGHIGLQFRISKKVGFGMVVAPYSNMGYELSITEKNPDIAANIGNIKFDYVGSGGIFQVKGGFAYNLFDNFNLGANYIYYLGNFKQNMNTTITSYINNNSFRNFYDYRKSRVNQSSFEIGAQYVLPLKENRSINFGATFQPRIASRIERDTLITTNITSPSASDIIKSTSSDEEFYFPMKVAFGVSYNTTKLLTEINYTYQDWGNSFPSNNISGLKYSSKHEVRGGIQYTPNRFDIRSQMKRWSYRAGFMVGNSYMEKNGHNNTDFSGSLGIGVPLERNWFSLLNAAVEVGQSGALKAGQVQTTFVKLNIGISFSAGNWFVRHKYK